MATPKQVRKIMRKIYYHEQKLQEALDEAHHKDIIVYANDVPDSYKQFAPCWAMDRVRERITLTTKDVLALTMKTEIKASIK